MSPDTFGARINGNQTRNPERQFHLKAAAVRSVRKARSLLLDRWLTSAEHFDHSQPLHTVAVEFPGVCLGANDHSHALPSPSLQRAYGSLQPAESRLQRSVLVSRGCVPGSNQTQSALTDFPKMAIIQRIILYPHGNLRAALRST
jgi:hypothetical protein